MKLRTAFAWVILCFYGIGIFAATQGVGTPLVATIFVSVIILPFWVVDWIRDRKKKSVATFSLVVGSTAGFPPAPFKVLIDSGDQREILDVVGVHGNTLEVKR